MVEGFGLRVKSSMSQEAVKYMAVNPESLCRTSKVATISHGRHNGGLIYFGSSYKHCQHDLADH